VTSGADHYSGRERGKRGDRGQGLPRASVPKEGRGGGRKVKLATRTILRRRGETESGRETEKGKGREGCEF